MYLIVIDFAPRFNFTRDENVLLYWFDSSSFEITLPLGLYSEEEKKVD